MPTVTIRISKKFDNTSKTGKKYVSILDENDVKYNVWDTMVSDRLTEGQTAAVVVEEKNGFKNVVGIGFIEGEVAAEDNPFDDTPAPKPKTAETKALSEVELLVGERKEAYHMAVILVAAGLIKGTDIAVHANKALAYYRGSEPQVEQKSSTPPTDTSEDNAEDFIK